MLNCSVALIRGDDLRELQIRLNHADQLTEGGLHHQILALGGRSQLSYQELKQLAGNDSALFAKALNL